MQKINIKNSLVIFTVIFILIAVFLLYPRRVEHAIYIKGDNTTSIFYVNGKEKTFNFSEPSLKKFTIVNFSYNIFKVYDFENITPLKERIMSKSSDIYELENSGPQKLNPKASFFMVDENDAISEVNSSKLIVGKYNVQSYKDRNNLLKTFILSPLDYSTVRVAISSTGFKSIYHKDIKLQTNSPIKVYSHREKLNWSFPENTMLTFERSGNSIKLIGYGVEKEFKDRLYIECNNLALISVTRDEVKTPSYSGILEIIPTNNGILMINEVNIDEYLTKVVPSEMSASSGIEALKCQAIAARTYVISDMLSNRFASQGFYVDDSIRSQVYNNILPQPSSTEAVNKTKGLVITYNKLPIDAKYYSTSCGTGVNYGDIWFNSDGSSDEKPYLKTSNYLENYKSLPSTEDEWLNFYKSKDIKAVDSASPYYRWQIAYPSYALNSTLKKSLASLYKDKKDYMIIKQDNKEINTLPDVMNISDIKILKRSEGGNILKIAFLFENATVEVSGDSNIRRAIKCSKEYAGTTISVFKQSGTPLTNIDSILSSFFSVEKVDDTFMIYGGGYGHGVGMSQYGAMEMAKKGLDYSTILNTFYKDVKVIQFY